MMDVTLVLAGVAGVATAAGFLARARFVAARFSRLEQRRREWLRAECARGDESLSCMDWDAMKARANSADLRTPAASGRRNA